MAIFAPFGLHDADDALRLVDVADLEPDGLAGTQTAAVTESEQHADLGVLRHRQQALHLEWAHNQRDLLRLFDVIDLGREIQAPQRDAEQKPHSRHEAVAIADAEPVLDKEQLKPTNIVGGGRFRRAPQERGEPDTAVDVASLRMPTELARSHVLDHALAQLAGGVGTHGKLLSWMRLTTPRSSRQGCTPRYRCSQLVTAPSDSARRSGLLRSDLVPWHQADHFRAAAIPSA